MPNDQAHQTQSLPSSWFGSVTKAIFTLPLVSAVSFRYRFIVDLTSVISKYTNPAEDCLILPKKALVRQK